jgi:hypothetical protein
MKTGRINLAGRKNVQAKILEVTEVALFSDPSTKLADMAHSLEVNFREE